ncbi:MAG: DUF4328 domain-containing protein [Planctomycetota bacterium]|jgi:hypothetical protein|nr:DUF4328 domain-containing protein [Planctomycetota bacterium]
MAFLIQTTNGTKGPFSPEQLQAFVDAGKLRNDHKVRTAVGNRVITVGDAIAGTQAAPATNADMFGGGPVFKEEPAPPAQQAAPARAVTSDEPSPLSKAAAADEEAHPFAPPSAKVETRTQRRGQRGRGRARFPYRSAKGRAMAATITLGASGLATLIGIFTTLSQRSLFSDGYPSESAVEANDQQLMMVTVLQIVVWLVALICYLMWVNRVNKNADALSNGSLEIKSGWAVGWYFVPIANLWKPFTSMKEIFLGSGYSAVPPIVGIWWTVWVIQSLVARAVDRMYRNVDDIPSLMAANGLDLVNMPLFLVALGCMVAMVRQLTATQDENAQIAGL